jgi:anti-sigma B factor antagonist
MQIAIDDAGSAATVVLNGRLDIAGADVVALPLATLSGAKDKLTIDMAGVTFVASIGLRHLVAAAKAIGRRGGTMVVANPNAAVIEIITTSGLGDILKVQTGGSAPPA